MLDAEFVKMLVCPACKTAVQLQEEWLVCVMCGRRYPIRDGIPVMLIEEAQQPK